MTAPGPTAPPERLLIRLLVPAECDRWRLDHFLKHRITRLSRAKIREIIETQVRLADGRRARPAAGVRGGEVIVIDRPAPVEPPAPRHFEILYEDSSLLAINKPAGLPIHATAKFYRNTLTAVLRERYPDQGLQVAHRLDRETSGVLLVARGPQAGASLKRAFARRAVEKTYLALVHGMPHVQGEIDQPIRLLDTPTRVMMGPAGDGSPALTRYRVVRSFARHALVEAEPRTGRQHQIRVHLACIGHPIVGDKLYGAGEKLFMTYCDRGLTPELLAAFDGLDRHALHAHRLSFPHPATGARMTVECPLPEDLSGYMAGLEPSSDDPSRLT